MQLDQVLLVIEGFCARADLWVVMNYLVLLTVFTRSCLICDLCRKVKDTNQIYGYLYPWARNLSFAPKMALSVWPISVTSLINRVFRKHKPLPI